MDKVFTFLMITITMSLILGLAGLGSGINTYTIVSQAINGTFEFNIFWITISTIFAALVLATGYQALIAGNSSAAITTGSVVMATFLLSFVGDIFYVLSLASTTCLTDTSALCGISYYIIMIIMIPIAFGFAWSLAQFVLGGGD